MADELAEFRVLPGEMDATALLPFVPSAADLVKQGNNRLGKLQQMLAQTATVHAAGTHLIANTEWDLTAIYYEGIDRFGHEFMHLHPPKMDQVSQEEFDAYQHCMIGIYRFHDMLLDTLLQLAGPETAVILMSDHGYYNDHLRPNPREGMAGPTDWHRPFGIFAASGPTIRGGARVYGASILDIVPTILQVLGLPAAYDMPGRVLAEALSEPALIDRIESWEEIDGESGMHAEELRADPAESQVLLERLVALGYIDPPSEDAAKTVKQTIASNQFNLAQSLADERRFGDAILVLENLDETWRNDPPAQILLANCLLGVDDKTRARAILESLTKAECSQPRVHMMLGVLEFADGNANAALEHLEQVAKQDQRLPGLHNKLGEVYLEVSRYRQAIEAFEKALAIDSDSPVAYAGLARCWLELGEPQTALDNALIAAELTHFLPRAHYVIGKALVDLGDLKGAVEALELCIRQAPRMALAHKMLASAYRQLNQPAKAMAAELRAKGVMA
jgi:tetratricopeptide (TPR) repeat protein